MNFRQRVGLAWTPLPLRLGLAIAFVWAGAGKVFDSATLTSAQAGELAAMGVRVSGGVPGSDAPKRGEEDSSKPNSTPKPSGPDTPLPAPTESAEPSKSPEGATRTKHPPAGAGSVTPGKAARPSRKSQASAASLEPALDGSEGAPRAAANTQDAPIAPVDQTGGGSTMIYPDGVRVRALYRLALLLRSSSAPERASGGEGQTSSGGMALWPARLASGSAPAYCAWAVALTELFGGVFVLAGLLTRLSAAGLAGVMFGAIWLTQIGPALQAGKTTLGFLPTYGAYDVAAWMPLQWQTALLCMSVALLFAGPGTVAMDNILWGGTEKKKPGPPPAKPT